MPAAGGNGDGPTFLSYMLTELGIAVRHHPVAVSNVAWPAGWMVSISTLDSLVDRVNTTVSQVHQAAQGSLVTESTVIAGAVGAVVGTVIGGALPGNTMRFLLPDNAVVNFCVRTGVAVGAATLTTWMGSPHAFESAAAFLALTVSASATRGYLDSRGNQNSGLQQ